MINAFIFYVCCIGIVITVSERFGLTVQDKDGKMNLQGFVFVVCSLTASAIVGSHLIR